MKINYTQLWKVPLRHWYRSPLSIRMLYRWLVLTCLLILSPPNNLFREREKYTHGQGEEGKKWQRKQWAWKIMLMCTQQLLIQISCTFIFFFFFFLRDIIFWAQQMNQVTCEKKTRPRRGRKRSRGEEKKCQQEWKEWSLMSWGWLNEWGETKERGRFERERERERRQKKRALERRREVQGNTVRHRKRDDYRELQMY